MIGPDSRTSPDNEETSVFLSGATDMFCSVTEPSVVGRPDVSSVIRMFKPTAPATFKLGTLGFIAFAESRSFAIFRPELLRVALPPVEFSSISAVREIVPELCVIVAWGTRIIPVAGSKTASVIDTFIGIFSLMDHDALRVGKVTPPDGSTATEDVTSISDTVMTCFVASSVKVNDPFDTEMFSMPIARGGDVVPWFLDGVASFVGGLSALFACFAGRP